MNKDTAWDENGNAVQERMNEEMEKIRKELQEIASCMIRGATERLVQGWELELKNQQPVKAKLILAGTYKAEWGFLVGPNDDCIKSFRVNLSFRRKFLEFIKDNNIGVTNKESFAWIKEGK